MRIALGHACRVVAFAVLVAAAFGGGVARAQLRLTLEPSYQHVETDLTDQVGRLTHQATDLLTQNYRLTLDRALTERFAASLGGTFLDQRGWIDNEGISEFATGRTSTAYGRLTLGTPTLAAGIEANYRTQRAYPAAVVSFITESYTAYSNWRPTDLPELDVRLSHVNNYDSDRRAQDTTTDSAVFSTRYQGPNYDLRYLLNWTKVADHRNDTDSSSIEQIVQGNRTDRLFGGRTFLYLSGTGQSRYVSTATGGQGGTVTKQQLPVAGLSAVETFPATTDNIALTPNPSLIDGNTGGSAGINVGFGAAGVDQNLRDVGASFADVVTPVNTLFVWVDRTLAPDVGRALAGSMSVWKSDDNQRWTPVGIAAAPTMSPFENRFEITIEQTQARYLKVVMRPLTTINTSDPAYRDVFVTELQLLLVLPAELVPRTQNSLAGLATGTQRTIILRKPDLAWDTTATVAHHTESDLTTWLLVNGLTVSQGLGWHMAGTARAARQDEDNGRGHEGLYQWSATLTGKPLQTAYWTLAYNGTRVDAQPEKFQEGFAQRQTYLSEPRLTHSVSALGRADWYQGVSTQVNAGASIANQGDHQTSTGQAGGTVSLTPNTYVTLTGAALYSRSVTFSPETGDIVSNFARVDGTLALTPAPALSATGTLTRIVLGAPNTLASVQVNYYPLRGELQLSMAYSKTLNVALEATTEIFTPALRWNIRRGVSWTTSYTFLEDVSPAQALTTRTLLTTLLITL